MTTFKTSDLTGAALDWAVAHASGITEPGRFFYSTFDRRKASLKTADHVHDRNMNSLKPYSPSTSWALAGPIIDTHLISTVHRPVDSRTESGYWEAWGSVENPSDLGPTCLAAAMRCYVRSKLGDSVDVPAELLP